jgi:hypothetical protein
MIEKKQGLRAPAAIFAAIRAGVDMDCGAGGCVAVRVILWRQKELFLRGGTFAW